MRHVFLPAVVLTVLVAAVPAFAVDLVVDGTSQTLGGTQTYDNVSIVNGGVLNVATYDGDPTSTGLLHLVVAGTLTVDASSSIIGDGRGYQGQTNANGDGPGGGQGGACCYDSGGGGGYGGTGGTGSRDNSSAPDGVGGGPYGASDSVAFQMGSGGGAAGSLDGDYGGQGGAGGAAIWIEAAVVSIDGTVSMNGNNGANFTNDAAGGGAGGGILIEGTSVTLGAGSTLRANGGSGANVDDDGGGGAGGRIKVFYGAGVLSGTTQVNGGSGPGPATDGGPGTVHTENVDAPPVADDQAVTTDEDVAAPITLTGIDPEGLPVTFTLASLPTSGVLTGAPPTLVYTPDPDVSGADSFTFTVNDGALDSAPATVSITIDPVNDLPNADAAGPYVADEGSGPTLDGSGSSDIEASPVSWEWDCTSDGSFEGTGEVSTDCVYADDGAFVVTLQVTDSEGATATSTAPVTIDNVAPIITTSPATVAAEGAPYSYLPSADDPGADPPTWALALGAPSGMTIDPSTGEISWTPSYSHALAGSAAVTLTVDDGDGGTDVQSWVITVTWIDTDGDGLPDGFETVCDLDPTDPTDALDDADGDGVTNLDEFLSGSDPCTWDGPGAPIPISPIAGAEVITPTPDLVFDNVTDPQGDALTYDVEVWLDVGLTLLHTAATGVVEDPSGTSEWKVDVALTENSSGYWRVRADDGSTAGPWSVLESFVVNEYNEPPSAPGLIYPVDGEAVGPALDLRWAPATDPDGDALTYSVVVLDAADDVVFEATDVPAADPVITAALAGLVENATYSWQAAATDEHGLEGAWSEPELFVVDAEASPPEGISWLHPLEGDTLEDVSPLLLASEGTDPDGDAVVLYRFELDTAASFDSPALLVGEVAGLGDGTAAWDLAEDGLALEQDTTWYGSVRGVDEDGDASAPDVISFFVAGDDDPPPTPELLAPADGSEVQTFTPPLVVENVEDPEGDAVLYDFVVARDAGLTDVVTERSGVLRGSGSEGSETQTSWTVDLNLSGEVFWSARAVDVGGHASDWAAPWSFTVADGGAGPPGDDDDDDGEAIPECGCSSSAGSAAPLSWALGLLVVGVLYRRRSCTTGRSSRWRRCSSRGATRGSPPSRGTRQSTPLS